MTTRPWQVWRLVATAALSLIVGGCQNNKPEHRDSVAGQSAAVRPDTQSARNAQRDALLNEARNDYTVPSRDEEPIKGDLKDIGDSGAVAGIHVTSAAMTRKPGLTKPEAHHFVGRFHSNMKYDRLGIGVGDNYIWRDDSGGRGNSRFFILPTDPTMSVRLIVNRKKKLKSEKDHGYPRVLEAADARGALVLGICGECPIGHCGMTDAGAAFY